MNAYIVDGGEIRVYCDEAVMINAFESYPSRRLVYAETRGQAKADFIHWWACNDVSEPHYEFEWTNPISVKLWQRDVNQVRGVADDDDPTWLDYLFQVMTA
jgi:hypothetical protein